MANKPTGTKEPTTAQTNQQPPPASGPVVAIATPIQPPVVTPPAVNPPAAGASPADGAPKPPAAKPPPADRSARAFDAVDYPVMACIGCNSTNTVRIDEHLKKPFHRRRCRSCGKEFKEPLR